ncbi:MAG: glycine cleavage system protein GcvH [Flavobacteriales bacterium]|nr:glycine cleavage system protein GcvH [Flavobacteriales bacterium]
MTLPEDLRYSKDHEWIRVDGDEATIGITEFAAGELGDIVYIEIDTLGESLNQDDVFGTVEAVKTVSDLFIPVGGTVLEMNTALEDQPSLVNSDPYGEGWIVKIKIDSAEDLESLMTHSSYGELVA